MASDTTTARITCLHYVETHLSCDEVVENEMRHHDFITISGESKVIIL